MVDLAKSITTPFAPASGGQAGSGIAPPEVTANVDTAETGIRHLTAQEEQNIVSFLKTLTDGYK